MRGNERNFGHLNAPLRGESLCNSSVVEEETFILGNRGRGANKAFLCSSMAHHKEGLVCC